MVIHRNDKFTSSSLISHVIIMAYEVEVIFMGRCNSCFTNKSQCMECADNPIYKDIPRQSFYQKYIPTCPRGYKDCVNDPAYIKYNHPKWYKETFGNMTPEQAAEQCRKVVEEDPDEEYYCYDNEDK